MISVGRSLAALAIVLTGCATTPPDYVGLSLGGNDVSGDAAPWRLGGGAQVYVVASAVGARVASAVARDPSWRAALESKAGVEFIDAQRDVPDADVDRIEQGLRAELLARLERMGYRAVADPQARGKPWAEASDPKRPVLAALLATGAPTYILRTCVPISKSTIVWRYANFGQDLAHFDFAEPVLYVASVNGPASCVANASIHKASATGPEYVSSKLLAGRFALSVDYGITDVRSDVVAGSSLHRPTAARARQATRITRQLSAAEFGARIAEGVLARLGVE